MGAKLADGNRLLPLERGPDLLRPRLDAGMLPLLRRARRPQGREDCCLGFRDALHAVRCDGAEALCRQPTLKRRSNNLASGVMQPPKDRCRREEFLGSSRRVDPLEPGNPLGWSRDNGRVRTNEEPDAAIAAELRVRGDDDARTPKRRHGKPKEARPVRVDAFSRARLSPLLG